MINLAAAIGLGGKQKDPNKDTAVGNVPPHSHDNSKNNNTMNPIGNITGNLNNNLKVQELGANLFQGEALAEQEMAKRNLGKPVMPPSPDPMGDQYGMQFNQPFAQKNLTVHPVPQQPPLEPPRVPEVPTKPTTKIYKEMVPKQKMVKELTGLQVEQRTRRHEEKMEKPEMPKKVIPPTNMMIGVKKPGVKKPKDPNKGRPYVVNKEKTGTSRDTLFLPKDAYVSKDGYADDVEIRQSTREAIAKKIYNLPKDNDMSHFSHLEGSGKAKYKK